MVGPTSQRPDEQGVIVRYDPSTMKSLEALVEELSTAIGRGSRLDRVPELPPAGRDREPLPRPDAVSATAPPRPCGSEEAMWSDRRRFPVSTGERRRSPVVAALAVTAIAASSGCKRTSDEGHPSVGPPLPLTPVWTRRFVASVGEPLSRQVVVAGGRIYVVASFEGTITTDGGSIASSGGSDIMIAALGLDGGLLELDAIGGEQGETGGSLVASGDDTVLAGISGSTFELGDTELSPVVPEEPALFGGPELAFAAWFHRGTARRAVRLFDGAEVVFVQLLALRSGRVLAIGAELGDGWRSHVQWMTVDGRTEAQIVVEDALLRPLGVVPRDGDQAVLVGADRGSASAVALLTERGRTTDVVSMTGDAPTSWIERDGRWSFFGQAEKYGLGSRAYTSPGRQMRIFGFGTDTDGTVTWHRPSMIDAVTKVAGVVAAGSDHTLVAVWVLGAGTRAVGRREPLLPGTYLLRVDRDGHEVALYPVPALSHLSAAAALPADRLVLVGACAGQTPTTANRDKFEEFLDLKFYPEMCVVVVDVPPVIVRSDQSP
jgi:hypothetical protein